MKLWKEAGATLLTAAGLTLALSVTQGWDWPAVPGCRDASISESRAAA
jgi:hypothetical protein